ncbi:MAG: hypothetical protein JWM49_2254 [Microbacteriaceae bacterium]|nr:hypothetical protein [Microbacteriaceae bacterium]
MSNNVAIELPSFVPHELGERPRHIEIVTTRSQKRARPRLVYALVGVGGLFAILMTQLLLSILLSHGAYQIAALQSTQVQLSRDQQTITEALNVLQSPQNLAARAGQLGMVTNTGSQGFLSLTTGVTRAPTAATANTSVTPGDAVMTPNALITPSISNLGAAAAAAASAASIPPNASVSGAPAGSATGASVASNPGALPSPITH